MDKPKFLYHGSRYKVDTLLPHQANGSPEENGTEFGVYAYEKEEMVIPFSLTITPFENGAMAIYVDDDTSDVTISAGIWDDSAVGYIYKIQSETFEKIDSKQWISREPVTPIDCKTVFGKDYAHKVHLDGKAKEYCLRSK
jgi:hypothetical protein